MRLCLWVAVAFGKTEVNDVDMVLFRANTHQKVVWLDISVQEAFIVNIFNAL